MEDREKVLRDFAGEIQAAMETLNQLTHRATKEGIMVEMTMEGRTAWVTSQGLGFPIDVPVLTGGGLTSLEFAAP
jgi:hypothetical protein